MKLVKLAIAFAAGVSVMFVVALTLGWTASAKSKGQARAYLSLTDSDGHQVVVASGKAREASLFAGTMRIKSLPGAGKYRLRVVYTDPDGKKASLGWTAQLKPTS